MGNVMHKPNHEICVFGLGEAGGLFIADLADDGMNVPAYDPRPVATDATIR